MNYIQLKKKKKKNRILMSKEFFIFFRILRYVVKLSENVTRQSYIIIFSDRFQRPSFHCFFPFSAERGSICDGQVERKRGKGQNVAKIIYGAQVNVETITTLHA